MLDESWVIVETSEAGDGQTNTQEKSQGTQGAVPQKNKMTVKNVRMQNGRRQLENQWKQNRKG